MRYAQISLLSFMLCVGCGFSPLHSPEREVQMSDVLVRTFVPESIEGYHVKQRLAQSFERIEQSEPNRSADFDLSVELEFEEDRSAVSTVGSASRSFVNGTATWKVQSSTAVDPVWTGSVRSFVGVDTSGSTVAVQTAQRNARRDLALALADLVVAQVMWRIEAQ